MKITRRSFLAVMGVSALASMLAGCGGTQDASAGMSDSEKAAWSTAAADIYGKYPELVTYTTGYNLTNQGADVLKDTPYASDTTEDNAYTRYLKEVLNVQNSNQFEATTGDDYDQKVSMAVASQEIPDAFHVDDYATFVELVESDMLEDLTDVYNNMACDTVKKAYESYGDDNNPLGTVTFDGKVMAIPKTQLSDGQDFLWLRQDWLDKLGLTAPKSLDEMEAVLQAFKDKDPNGTGDNVGLILNSEVYGGYPNNHFIADNIFTALNAYPYIWIKGSDGKAVYGSVQPEMKEGLARLRDWYAKGLIDPEFTTRTYDDNVALLAGGQCGAYIGPWWSPFITGQTASYAEGANWVNVSCPVGSDGKINAINTKSYAGFVVVRKDYEHPELAMKIVNVNSEYSKQDTSDASKEILENQSLAYFNWPLYCEVQPGNNAELMTQHVKDVLDGNADSKTLTTEETGYYEAAQRFLAAEAAGTKAESADYSQYMSRLKAIYVKINEPANFTTPAFFETTETMKLKWASLEKMEMQTMLKIIVGEAEMDTFDDFVKSWTEAGGDTITQEVNDAIAK